MNDGTSITPSRPSGQLSPLSRIRRGRYTTSVVVGLLWLFGLFSVFLSPAPIRITPEMQQRYDQRSQEASKIEAELNQLYDYYLAAKAYTDTAKVWFWRFKTEARNEVRLRQIPERAAWDAFQKLRRRYKTAVSDAKAELGVWTEAGVSEGRQLFWSAYKQGKLFAQSHSLSDLFFHLLTVRDSDALGHLLGFLGILLVNFTAGMVSALFIFLAQLPVLILSFQPNFLSGVLFFLTCALGGISIIASFLGLMYGSSIVFVTAVTSPGLRAIEGRRPQRHRLTHSHVD